MGKRSYGERARREKEQGRRGKREREKEGDKGE